MTSNSGQKEQRRYGSHSLFAPASSSSSSSSSSSKDKFFIMRRIVVFSIFYLISDIHRVQALKCYTCGETNKFLGPNYTTTVPLPCDNFESSERTDLNKFIIECPSDYLGCITQIQGEVITRTCDTFAIDDCQTANGVTYCYCNYDLCNDHSSVIEAKNSQRQNENNDDDVNGNDDNDQNDEDSENSNDGMKKARNYNDQSSDVLSDDEDYVDMSGFGHIKSNYDDDNDSNDGGDSKSGSDNKFDDVGMKHNENEDGITIDNGGDENKSINMNNVPITSRPFSSIFTVSSTTVTQQHSKATTQLNFTSPEGSSHHQTPTIVPATTFITSKSNSSISDINQHKVNDSNNRNRHNSSVKVSSLTSIQCLHLVLIGSSSSSLIKFFHLR